MSTNTNIQAKPVNSISDHIGRTCELMVILPNGGSIWGVYTISKSVPGMVELREGDRFSGILINSNSRIIGFTSDILTVAA